MSTATETAPVVYAKPGQYRCGDRYEAQGGINCDRPVGHDGGHLSKTGNYWQAKRVAS
jgi:hypothetical protein